MTCLHRGQEFAIVSEYRHDGPGLGRWDGSFFWFSDGDGYSPDNLELTFGPVEYLTLYQLEERLFVATKKPRLNYPEHTDPIGWSRGQYD